MVIPVVIPALALAEPDPPPAAATAGAGAPQVLCELPTPDPGAPPLDKVAKKKAAGLLALAKKAYFKGDFPEALRQLQAAYVVEPLLDTLYNVAQTCREMGGYDEQALGLYERALKQSSDEELKKDCERHIKELRPRLAKQRDQEAQKALLTSDFTAAVARWEQAQKLDPQPAYLWAQAQAQRQAGSRAEALASYERFLEVYASAEQAAQAKSYIAKLKAELEAERAQKHSAAQEYLQALASYQAAHRLDPQPIYIYRIAEVAQQVGQSKEALASYRRFLKETSPTELSAERTRAEAQVRTLGTTATEVKPIYKKPWFWVVVGLGAAAVAGGVAGAVVATRPAGDPFTGVTLDGQQNF